MTPVLLVMTNVPDARTAQLIAEQLLQKKLAACVNILPQMRSLYVWNEQQEVASEIGLLIKTTETCYAALQTLIAELHPYDLPEIIAIPVADGLPAYLQWVRTETGRQ
ncbi:MAG: divalent-cation tolerance protein CutA [Burkholderiales bacterium]|nr:divalent-cation tolerance protein CutA [Burkholderiales bacterium]